MLLHAIFYFVGLCDQRIDRYTDPRRLLRCDEELPRSLFFSGTLAEKEHHRSVTAVDVRILKLRLQARENEVRWISLL